MKMTERFRIGDYESERSFEEDDRVWPEGPPPWILVWLNGEEEEKDKMALKVVREAGS